MVCLHMLCHVLVHHYFVLQLYGIYMISPIVHTIMGLSIMYNYWHLCAQTMQSHSGNINNVYLSPSYDIINSVESLRVLGVIMSNSCSFNAHISNTVLSCSRLIGWILRTFSKRDKSTVLTLFNAVVRPVLEYGVSRGVRAQ